MSTMEKVLADWQVRAIAAIKAGKIDEAIETLEEQMAPDDFDPTDDDIDDDDEDEDEDWDEDDDDDDEDEWDEEDED